jgi:hypothetical protein
MNEFRKVFRHLLSVPRSRFGACDCKKALDGSHFCVIKDTCIKWQNLELKFQLKVRLGELSCVFGVHRAFDPLFGLSAYETITPVFFFIQFSILEHEKLSAPFADSSDF